MKRVSKQVFRFLDKDGYDEHQFACHLDSEQCQDHIKNGKGRRCKN